MIHILDINRQGFRGLCGDSPPGLYVTTAVTPQIEPTCTGCLALAAVADIVDRAGHPSKRGRS